MKRKPGDKVSSMRLPAIDGTRYDLDGLEGKPYMLSFFRFASCPFCNLRMHELVTKFDQLPNGFTIVAVFDSPLDNLQRHAGRHHAPFPILADENNTYYKLYDIEHSLPGVLRGMLFRMPRLMYGLFGKGYLPLRIKGSLTTLPADFLVDRRGIIREAYYGKDEGDHLPFARIRDFASVQ
jgi:thioredoxin-dependent peroxiredoxin